MDTLVSDQSSPMTYTNRFCVAMLAVFATYNPSEAALTVLSTCISTLWVIHARYQGQSLFTGLDHWTGLLDWNTGLTFDPKIAHKRLHLAPYSLVGRVGL